MNLKTLVVVSAVLLSSLGAQAEKRKGLVDEFSGQGYGMGGCGPGSILFGEKPGMVQIVAASTNNIYSAQTFAISSGTSNCGESSKSAATEQFINVNKLAIEKDLARGGGETVAALGQTMGCKNSSFTNEIVQTYKANFHVGQATVNDVKSIAQSSCQL